MTEAVTAVAGAVAEVGSPTRVPVSTYRLQLEPDFTLDDAAQRVDYLATLGVTHLYLSPLLQATPGSKHGYDVTDHRRVSAGLGGDPALRRLVEAARAAGLGLVVDIVPNHMTMPTPLTLNPPLWSVLREGRGSDVARWFDIDWEAGDGTLLVPVLGSTLEDVLDAGELSTGTENGEAVVRYHDHVFPIAAGTEMLPLPELVAAQHYRLASWRVGSTHLNYRRFFDVTSLIAVRVEDPEVFKATHERILELVRSGDVDGLRIDHPDGLADPDGYLRRLAEATDGAWVVVEKILEGDERLPAQWRCAGTTGYDAMLRIGGLFVDPAGAEPLAALSTRLLGERQDLDEIITAAKHEVVERLQGAEVNRLTVLAARVRPDDDPAALRRALVALLVSMHRYRAYVTPGRPMDPDAAAALAEAESRAAAAVAPSDRPAVRDLVRIARGAELEAPAGPVAEAAAEFMVRFQQTCGPVMAKSIEDTAYYRYVRLVGLNEVGGDPSIMGVAPRDFHAFAAGLAEHWPLTMTSLSTHDTKRSEDVRARLFVLSERPQAWAEWLDRARELATSHRPGALDAATEYFLWQTVVGAWPISFDRLDAYALKAIREAKSHTIWTDPDPDYEAAVARFLEGVTDDGEIVAHVEAWIEATAAQSRAATLGQKLVQLMMPGVPDVYQGNEIVDRSLVDPDNRRLVDYDSRARRLARLDGGHAPHDLDDEKLFVTLTALRVRREQPHVFVGEDGAAAYLPVEATSDHVVAFARGDREHPAVVVLATRLAGRLADAGGWAEATVDLPAGQWRDLLSERTAHGGAVPLANVLPPGALPVALLVRVPEE